MVYVVIIFYQGSLKYIKVFDSYERASDFERPFWKFHNFRTYIYLREVE